MCNLTDHFNEEEFFKQLEEDEDFKAYIQTIKREWMEVVLKSIEDRVDKEIDPYEHTHRIPTEDNL